MADGRWTMTEEELNRVVTGMRTDRRGDLPNHGMHRQIDARPGTAPEQCCAFCGSADLQTGFGGSGDGASPVFSSSVKVSGASSGS